MSAEVIDLCDSSSDLVVVDSDSDSSLEIIVGSKSAHDFEVSQKHNTKRTVKETPSSSPSPSEKPSSSTSTNTKKSSLSDQLKKHNKKRKSIEKEKGDWIKTKKEKGEWVYNADLGGSIFIPEKKKATPILSPLSSKNSSTLPRYTQPTFDPTNPIPIPKISKSRPNFILGKQNTLPYGFSSEQEAKDEQERLFAASKAKKVIRDEINKTLERLIPVHQLAPDFYKKLNYYSRLGLPKDSSLNDVKKQYREIAKVWHPDKKGGDEEVFRRVKEAYEGINELLNGD
ncbi:hypothetical protein TrLO_g9784 [Triparma laevis f. longispina]|uniref:J domain-containing protein n=1 Tax=Triparma laevis f. longispina TaxID=1714387 RepID=A0A9W7FHM0_9STRA|nr:hypothetical protein TrLO_g9784 [Triparma laevis f. longispina]